MNALMQCHISRTMTFTPPNQAIVTTHSPMYSTSFSLSIASDVGRYKKAVCCEPSRKKPNSFPTVTSSSLVAKFTLLTCRGVWGWIVCVYVYEYVYVCLCVCVCDTSIAVVVYYYNSSVSRVLAWQINNLLMANKLPVQSGKVSQQAMHSIRPDTIVLPCGCQQHRGCALLLPNTELTEIWGCLR